MEEDNRSFHLSHPFRQYQHRRISGANLVNTTASASASAASGPSLLPGRLTNDASTPRCCSEVSSADNCSRGSSVLPPRQAQIRNTSSKTGQTGVVTDATVDDKNRPILGMTAVENDDGDGSRSLTIFDNVMISRNHNDRGPSVNHNDIAVSGNGERQEEQRRVPQENPSWFEETHQLFRDYKRRFHRQSLTEQAKELFDRAAVLARGNSKTSKDDKDNNIHNHNDGGESNHDGSCNNNILASIGLCTEALALCRRAIEDQEQALNENDVIGGSYLVTGDIRLRRKGEALAARIHCLRAAVRYQASSYEESLEDCEAAIAIWNQQGDRARLPRAVVGRRSLRAPGNTNATKAITGHDDESKSEIPKRQQSRRLLLSRKHLYLLKGRVLAAMGRYRDAVVWLTHPRELPTRTFRRSSALLETDAAMNRFLDQLLVVSRGGGGKRRGGDIPKEERDFPVPQPNMTSLLADSTEAVSIPTDKKLWSNLLHSVDKRLNEGMAGKLQATSNVGGNGGSNSGNAIYQMLRHGPVLFHHYHNNHRDDEQERG